MLLSRNLNSNYNNSMTSVTKMFSSGRSCAGLIASRLQCAIPRPSGLQAAIPRSPSFVPSLNLHASSAFAVHKMPLGHRDMQLQMKKAAKEKEKLEDQSLDIDSMAEGLSEEEALEMLC